MKAGMLVAFLFCVARVSLAGGLQILYPLYNYPDWYSPSSYIWKDIADQNAVVPITAIIDPDNGPGDSGPNTDYQQGMADLAAGGVKMIGYVPTGDGTTPIATVEGEIDQYASFYPDISGIFLDEESTDPSLLSYYQTIHNYILTKPSLASIVANPGTNIPQAYISGSTADTTVLFESGSDWNSYVPDSYVTDYPSSDFAAIFYNLPTASDMESAIDLAVQRNFGYVFATDGTGSNPYDTLPSYWATETAYIASVPEPSPIFALCVLPIFIAVLAPRRRVAKT